ncbi:hypothetical protein [Sphaerimonospora thailandensis]|uniref:Uncharacterized protein n=1 Tax=Sphaerimonospora thailandensis TaxID=795644 RepID=A0A8J3RB45_9ACTN|nr:hypothetical protein [Sphaerimonospora thailandensis]GIH71325.1 hypothetical protein Mth01_35780 [Sphaerimonospora thailandensis]
MTGGVDLVRRPELISLTGRQKEQVRDRAHRDRKTCTGCGSGEFVVGDALYLGYLFRSEPLDAYMIALTCANSSCPDPYNGITLHGPEFLPSP